MAWCPGLVGRSARHRGEDRKAVGMSIDARICGLRITDRVCLILEPREPRGCAGQTILEVLNPPADPKVLAVMVGECVWGGDQFLMFGDRQFAVREGYTKIRLMSAEQLTGREPL